MKQKKVATQEMASIQELFQSIGSIGVYRQGFDDGVEMVTQYLKTSMAKKSITLCNSLGLDPAEWKLDPVNGQFVSSEPEAADMLDENQRMIDALKSQKAELDAINSSRQAPAQKKATPKATPKARTNIVGAQPLALPDPVVPLASDKPRSIESSISNQVDMQINAVLESIKARANG